MSTYDYPFDETGLKASNRITGEQHILTIVNEHQYSKVIPRWAPFYADGFQARIRLPNNDIRTLVEGEDFYFGHYFASASRATGKNIYGSINLLDRSLQGAVIIDSYQTVGGKWTQSAEKILEILTNQIYNPRLVYWEEIAEVPEIFPVVDHEWNIVDMVGMADVTAKLSEIVSALLLTSDSGLVEHTSNMNNPHGTTKFQVGLGLVENYPVATEAEAREARSNVVYMTGLRVRQAIEEIAMKMIFWHINEEGNVHNLDISQLGAVNEATLNAALETKLGVNDTARDSDKLNGMSFTQLANTILLGTAANSMRLAGFSYEDLVTEVTSKPTDNASRLEGHTLDQVLEAAAQQSAADAEKLNGQTLEDFSPLVPIIANHRGRFSVTSSGEAQPMAVEPYYVKVGETTVPFDTNDDHIDSPVRALDVTINQISTDGNILGTGLFTITLAGHKAGMYRVVDLEGVKHFRLEIHYGDVFTDDLGEEWLRASVHALIDYPLHRISIATTAHGLVVDNFDVGVMSKPADMGWLEDVYEHPIPETPLFPDPEIVGDEIVLINKDDTEYKLPLQLLIDKLPEGPSAFEVWKRETGNLDASFIEYRDDITGNDAFTAWKLYNNRPDATFEEYQLAIKGDAAWVPVFATVEDGIRRVVQIVDWVNGEGTKPDTGYLGASGIVTDIALAVDIRGEQGLDAFETWKLVTAQPSASFEDYRLAIKGDKGDKGDNAWIPVLATVEDGERRVIQIQDWTGGDGVKPDLGYLGTTGIVANIADATDIRGAKGDTGEPGTDGQPGADAFETWKTLTNQPNATISDWLAAIYAAANP